MDLSGSVLDPRVRRYVRPVRVAWQSAGAAAPQRAEALLDDSDETACVLPPGAAVLLDFGRELHGGVQIERTRQGGHEPVSVRLRFGESASEAMGAPNNDHAIHDAQVDLPWYGHAEFGNTGFRFVRLDALEQEVALSRARAVFVYRDLAYEGAFRCSDARLNQIWATGAYTVHLCMQDFLWDGIKRDRLVWIGDMHPETQVASCVFGAVDVVPRSLDYVRDRTPLPHWMNGISSYSLWWVLIQHSWFVHHGDKAYLEEQREYLIELLAQLRTQVGADGSEKLGGHRFLDWPSSEDKTAVAAGLHALLTWTMTAGAALCRELGAAAAAEACEATAARLRVATPPETGRKAANALLALAGLKDAKAVNEAVLARDPLHDVSTFYGYYVLQARAAAGDYQGALEVIRRYWGAMLDLGATTFWEDFNLDWTPNAAGIDAVVPEGMRDIHGDFGAYCYKGLRHSLCHGWAAGPTAWLSEHVLGCRPLAPGCAKLLVAPHLAGLAFAEGAYPTPRGVVQVRHRRDDSGRVTTEVDAPDGVEIVRNTD